MAVVEPTTAPSLGRNLIFSTSGRVIFMISQFAIIFVVARLGSPEHVGALTLASALVTPLFFLTSMGMRDVHAVDDLVRFSRADYVAVRVYGGVFAILLTLLVAFTYLSSSGALVQSAAVALAAVRFFGAQASLNHGVFQRAERMDYVAASNLARSVLGVFAFALLYWWTRDLSVSLCAQAAAWFATNLLIDRRFLTRLGALTGLAELRRSDPGRVTSLIWWALPVGIALLLIRFALSAPPIVLERYVDLATVGVFGAMFYLHSALSMLATSIGSAALARLRRFYKSGRRSAFLSLTLKLSALAAVAGVIGLTLAWLVGDPVMGMLFGADYRNRELLGVVALASAIGIAGAPMVTALTAAQAFRRRLGISAFVCAAALVASMLLIPSLGAIGAAWALVVITSVQVALTTFTFIRIVGAIAPETVSDEADI